MQLLYHCGTSSATHKSILKWEDTFFLWLHIYPLLYFASFSCLYQKLCLFSTSVKFVLTVNSVCKDCLSYYYAFALSSLTFQNIFQKRLKLNFIILINFRYVQSTCSIIVATALLCAIHPIYTSHDLYEQSTKCISLSYITNPQNEYLHFGIRRVTYL